MMPGGISGYDVCKAVKTTDELSDIPVLMLSAKSQQKDIEEGLSVGADEYITKPFSPEKLTAKINKLIT